MSQQPTNRIKNKIASSEQPPTLTLLTEPEELEPGESFDPLDLEVLFGGGIVNPFGPTLTVVCAENKKNELGQQQIIELMLNPFTQSSRLLGHAIFDQRWEPLKHIPPLFDFNYGCCPTLLLPSQFYTSDIDTTLLGLFLHSFDDARDVLEKVKACPDDPFKRVQRDVDELPNIVSDFVKNRDLQCLAESSDHITFEEAKWLAGHLLDEQNAQQELAAFLFAWNGSIDFCPLPGADLDSIGPLFARLFYTSRVSLQVPA